VSNVYFIGDLHFGHNGIDRFRTQFPNEGVHRRFLMEAWNETINKRDVVFVMGDAAFTQEGLDDINTLSGRKILIRGNHDLLPTESYLGVFEEVYGLLAYKGLWLSHAPLHPTELYGRTNVHGHCHRGGPTEVVSNLDSFRGVSLGAKATYFNTCAEHLPTPYKPIKLDDMMEHIKQRIARDGDHM
jgi:calcineurin-like phosphoesterase family protein